MDENQNTFDYKPDGGSQRPQKSGGNFSWTASEYIDHKQGAGWFLSLTLVSVALAALFYFLTRDYFATATALIVGVIIGVFAKRTPNNLTYQLSADGLQIENKLYPLNHFRSFTIIEEGAISSVELMPLKKFMPPISVFFATADRQKIVAVLENYLPVEDRPLDGVERLSRRLRF